MEVEDASFYLGTSKLAFFESWSNFIIFSNQYLMCIPFMRHVYANGNFISAIYLKKLKESHFVGG